MIKALALMFFQSFHKVTFCCLVRLTIKNFNIKTRMSLFLQLILVLSLSSHVNSTEETEDDQSYRIKNILDLQVRNGLIYEDQGTVKFLQQSIFVSRYVDYSQIITGISELFQAVVVMKNACRQASLIKVAENRYFQTLKGTQAVKCNFYVVDWQHQAEYVQGRLTRALLPFKHYFEEAQNGDSRHSRALVSAAIVVGAKIIDSIVNGARRRDLTKKVGENAYQLGQLDLGLKNLTQQTQDIQRETASIAAKMNVLNKLSMRMGARISSVEERQRHIFGAVYQIVDSLTHFKVVDVVFTKLKMDTMVDIEILEEIVLSAIAGRPSHSVFPIGTLTSVKAKMEKDLQLAESPLSYTAKVSDFTDFAFKYTTIIPAYGEEDFTLLRIFAVPDLATQKVPVIKENLIAIKSDGMTYYPLTELQVQVCKSRGCRAPTSQRTISKTQCGTAQTITQDSSMCEWREYPSNYFLRKTQQGMIFAFSSKAFVQVTCDDAAKEAFELKKAGVLRIPPGCKATVQFDSTTLSVAGPNKSVKLLHADGQLKASKIDEQGAKVFPLRNLLRFPGQSFLLRINWLVNVTIGMIVLVTLLGILICTYLAYLNYRGRKLHAKVRRVRHQTNQVIREGTKLSEEAFASLTAHLTHNVIRPALLRHPVVQEVSDELRMDPLLVRSDERVVPLPCYPTLSDNGYETNPDTCHPTFQEGRIRDIQF